MSLFGSKEKQEIEELKAENAKLKSMVPSSAAELDAVNQGLTAKKAELKDLQAKVRETKTVLADLNSKVVKMEETALMQSFGLYEPRYDFTRSEDYKAKLDSIRDRQKQMIKNKTAVTGNTNWTVNGSASQGKKMVADMQKLLLRAFNAECDDIIERVRYNNIEASEKRITASKDAISKLGTIMSVSISDMYYRLKIEELYLAFEYARMKQDEKERQKELRAQMREEAKLAKELEEARKKLEKEQSHYNNALAKINAQLKNATGETRADLEAKKEEIVNQLGKIDKEFADVDYREANQKAGYVYIISNVGAFGENVYKIGMTRRLDPMDRVDELGDASVPFNFDVHAMIFSENAPKLEAALHNAFADKKVNYVNPRREFFAVSLDEIKRVVRENFDKSVEFVDVAPAEQYRETLAMKEQAGRA